MCSNMYCVYVRKLQQLLVRYHTKGCVPSMRLTYDYLGSCKGHTLCQVSHEAGGMSFPCTLA